MASEETIARATIELGADGSKLAPEMAAATAKAQAELDKANRRMERAQAATFKAIQGHIDRINAAKPTQDMRLLEQAVLKLGGTANLTKDQLARVTLEVNRLAAAGAKVPASLSGLTGIGSKLGSVFQALGTGGGLSGALAAIGPAGLAASAGLGAVTLAGGAAVRVVSELAAEGEKWANLAKSTGLGVVEVQQLSTLLKDASIPAEALGTAMRELQREIADGGKQLAKFGVEVSDLKELSPEDQLRAMAERIAAIEDPATKTAAAIAAFGRAGQELIPALDGIAAGADKAFDALSGDQIAALERADDVLDDLARKWEFLWKTAVAGAVEFAQTPAGRALLGLATFGFSEGARGALGAGGSGAPSSGRSGRADDSFWAEQERQRRVEMTADQAAAKERQAAAKRAAEEDRKAYEERLRSIQQANKAEAELILAREREVEAMRRTERRIAEASFEAEDRAKVPQLGGLGDPKKADQAIFEQAGRNARKLFDDLTKAGSPASAAMEQVRSRLEGMALSSQDLDSIMASLPSKIDDTSRASISWSDSLADLAHLMQGLGGLGGKVGNVLGGLATAISGIGKFVGDLKAGAAGGAGKGIAGALGKLGGGIFGKIGGLVSKAVPFLGLATSAISIGKSIFGGIKKLFGGKSKEEKAAEAAAKKQREDEAKQQAQQAKIQAARDKEQGLGTARGGAEALMERIAKGGLSEGLTSALNRIISKVGDALLKAGLGILDSRLKDSEGFQESQGIAQETAQAIAGMGQAGMVDADLLAAGGAVAREVQATAVEAAKAAGLGPEEATKAGFAAIAPLLKEQLNAAIRSGRELDANTAALLEEAKRNGIEILADPAIESLGVQKAQLSVLEQIAGKPVGTTVVVGSGGGGAGAGADPGSGSAFAPVDFEEDRRRFASGPVPEFALGGLIRAPAGGGIMTAKFHGDEFVIPKDAFRMAAPETGPSAILRGVARAGVSRGGRSDERSGSSTTNIHITEDPYHSSVGREALRKRTLQIVDQKASRSLSARIRAGRA